METTTIVRNERPDSMSLSTTAKGDITWDVKVYGDSATAEGREDMAARITEMKRKAQELARRPEVPSS